MNKITKEFITLFENKEKEEKQIIEEEILNYFANVKNEILFEKIKKYIFDVINDMIDDIDDIEPLKEIVNKYDKDEIIKIIKNETGDFDFYFKVKRIKYTFKLKLTIYFRNFEFYYENQGDTATFGENMKFNYIFNDNVNDDIKKIFKLLFIEDSLYENSEKWLYEYKELDDNE